jgi:hypothetical protein
MQDQRVEEANLEVAGQKIHLKSVALNTLLTIFVAIGVSLIGYMLFHHVAQADATLKEMVQAQRENNCLISIPEKDREYKAEFCKRITR